MTLCSALRPTVAVSVRHRPPESGFRRPFTFASFGDHGANHAPTDPAFAYATNATFTWPKASFDDNYDNAADPVLAYDPKPAETMTALVAAQQPVFHLVNGDVCSADPSGTGLPVDNTTASGSHGGSPAGMNAYNPYVGDVYLDQIEASASTIPWMISMGVAVAATAAAAVLLVGVGAFINHLGQAARTGAATDDVTDDVTDD